MNSTATAADSEFDLDITFITSGTEFSGHDTEDCTGDGCGGTDDSACTTC